jgi:hypothetical protein
MSDGFYRERYEAMVSTIYVADLNHDLLMLVRMVQREFCQQRSLGVVSG